ncbi:TPA: hypothetical protein DHW58_00795 [Patescibacteria group bacterium]|uniref:Uncharacterized protein n=2 Tax=Bacteria division Kazan-3B-28 TaxID=1798534 RepID=A0A0G1X6J7_UNCK3|nr:MAG: hypothetical protein VE98_C0001G0248 [candidate division Kazan bacterium GW2011_GWA1_50_15]KKW25477.1 MAG: hypothetical protein VE99_C0001G0114 [candidate division Kazan bacterium GW2011_GWC1_52_13]KKW26783.1 MAG: hypothetical protein VF00_C0002G0108 [candidate division Kazan bacterium GW2011_GWB1_52_7]HAV65778.1 hypothetical protein [Patescibacteria group bacterium]HCL47510.1 hypothetical protein [Patescibacteria group bacterium]
MGNEIANTLTNAVADQAKQAANTAAKGFVERLFDVYNSFISIFPEQYQWIVSLILVLAIASALFRLIQKNWLWLIVVVVLFPGILPLLKNIFDSLTILLVGKPLG